ncbi:MAG: hypothetical protein Q7K43_02580 [Candidatus Woesearchaeota archaeon]|nr:hypothetical protein [Candidatus Woesearchaeota archaeon]
MIGGIDQQADIELYLEAEEVKRIQAEPITGVLVKIEKPKRQGTISVVVNDARQNEDGFGIGVDSSKYWKVKDDFHITVFVGSEWYQQLLERGVISMRQRMLNGSKIHIYDKSKLEFIHAMRAESLEEYRDNKERLRDELG